MTKEKAITQRMIRWAFEKLWRRTFNVGRFYWKLSRLRYRIDKRYRRECEDIPF